MSVVSRSALVELLSPTLGQEKSEEAIAVASRKLGFGASDEFQPEQANAVMALLEQVDGIVGVVARYARARADMLAEREEEEVTSPSVRTSLAPPTPRVSVAPLSFRASAPPRSSSVIIHPTRVGMADLLGFLVPALGDEKARESILAYAALQGVRGEDFSHAEALSILESMARADGILGVAARFSKAHFILKYPG